MKKLLHNFNLNLFSSGVVVGGALSMAFHQNWILTGLLLVIAWLNLTIWYNGHQDF